MSIEIDFAFYRGSHWQIFPLACTLLAGYCLEEEQVIGRLKQALFGTRKSSDRAASRKKLSAQKKLPARNSQVQSGRSRSPSERQSPQPEKKRMPPTHRRQRDRSPIEQAPPLNLQRDRPRPDFWQKLRQKAAAAKTEQNSNRSIADLSHLRQLKSQSNEPRQAQKPQRRSRSVPERKSRPNSVKSTENLFRSRSGRLAAVAQRQAAQTKTRRPESAPRRARRSLPAPFVYGIRLLILGVGLGAISGTLLSAFSVTSNPGSTAANPAQNPAVETVRGNAMPFALPLKQESDELNGKIKTLVQQYPQMQTGALFVDLDTGVYAKLAEKTPLSAASTIKLPILVAFFQDVDRGKIALDEMLTMREELVAAEAGTMKNKQPGAQFSALETATKMITISDNTATNMLIDRLGGMEILNQRFRQWGLKSTVLHNPLPDVEGTNISSPIDLANLMAMVNQGDLVSLQSRDRLLQIMREVKTNTLLPQGLDENATIAHKTGSIGSLLADAGLVNTSTGKRYIAVVMVKRPRNDVSAKTLIRDLSRTAYQHFNQPASTPNTTNTPADTTSSVATDTQE